MELWHKLHVPLIHRSRFYLAFRGREVFYFEAEKRRLTWLQSEMGNPEGADPLAKQAAKRALARNLRKLDVIPSFARLTQRMCSPVAPGVHPVLGHREGGWMGFKCKKAAPLPMHAVVNINGIGWLPGWIEALYQGAWEPAKHDPLCG